MQYVNAMAPMALSASPPVSEGGPLPPYASGHSCCPVYPQTSRHAAPSHMTGSFVLLVCPLSVLVAGQVQSRSRIRRRVRERGRGFSMPGGKPVWTTGLRSSAVPPQLQAWLGAKMDPAVRVVVERIERNYGHKAWIVGGAIRDVLAGYEPADVDVATTMTPSMLQQVFRDPIMAGAKYGVVTVKLKGSLVECAQIRKPPDGMEGTRQEQSVMADSLLEDLQGRDFTVNALAVDLTRGVMYDPFCGQADIKERRLRAVSRPAAQMMRHDGLRVLRAYRFLAAYGDVPWSLDDNLASALQEEGAKLLANISRQRILQELKKILSRPRGCNVLKQMAEDGVLEAVLGFPIKAHGRELRAISTLFALPEVSTYLQCKEPKRLEKPHPKLQKEPSSRGRLFDDPLSCAVPAAKPQPFEYYAVVDFEATCWEQGQLVTQQEIIEFPVVLLHAASGTCIGEFVSFVRPTERTRLSSFCKRLTGISQSVVDRAPTFTEVALKVQSWLDEKTGGAEIAWVADGDWDLDEMLPAQWRRSFGNPVLPATWKQFIDVREVFQQVHPGMLPAGIGKIRMMCDYLRIPNVGPVHSGIADTRNVARILLTLIREGAICQRFPPSHVKALPRPFPHTPAKSKKTQVKASAATLASLESDASPPIRLFEEAMALMLAQVSQEEASEVMKQLHFSKDEQRLVAEHVLCLGELPDAKDAGAVRRFLVACGEDFVHAHLRLERAWLSAGLHDTDQDPTQKVDAADEEPAALAEITATELALAAQLADEEACVRLQRPLADGRWIQAETGLDLDSVGPIKEWLYYQQVDENLQSLEEVKEKLRSLECLEMQSAPMVAWPPDRTCKALPTCKRCCSFLVDMSSGT